MAKKRLVVAPTRVRPQFLGHDGKATAVCYKRGHFRYGPGGRYIVLRRPDGENEWWAVGLIKV